MGEYMRCIKRALEKFSCFDVSASNSDSDRRVVTFSTKIENETGTLTRKMNVTVDEEEYTLRFKTCLVPNVPKASRPAVYKMINDMQSSWLYVRMYIACGSDDLIADYMTRMDQTAYYADAFEESVSSVLVVVSNVTMRFAEQAVRVVCSGQKTGQSSLTPDQIVLNPFGRGEEGNDI